MQKYVGVFDNESLSVGVRLRNIARDFAASVYVLAIYLTDAVCMVLVTLMQYIRFANKLTSKDCYCIVAAVYAQIVIVTFHYY